MSIGFGTIHNANGPCLPDYDPFCIHLPSPCQSITGWREKQFSPSWHVLPVHWGGQIHLNPSTRSWQVPPWPQGFGEQSSISVMQNKERLSSVTQQAMSVTDKFDKWLLLLGFALRNRKTTGFLFVISRSTLISAKASFKNNSSVKGGSKHRGRHLYLWPFYKWKSDFDPARLSKEYFKQLTRMLQKFSVLLLSRSLWPFFPLAFNENLGTSKGEENAW